MSQLSISEVSFEAGQTLRRTIWQPIRWMLGIFHPLPAAAAIILLLLVAYVGQTRELYLSYLEAPKVVHIAWALAGFTLISATLYRAHYWLNTMRIKAVYSRLSQPNTGVNLVRLQRATGFIWAFSPWAGLAAGLLLTESYLGETYKKLCDGGDQATHIATLLTLPAVGPWTIAASATLLGLVFSVLFGYYRRSRIIKLIIILVTPSAAASVFFLLTSSYPITGRLPLIGVGAVIFYGVYYFLGTKKIILAYTAFYRDVGIDVDRRRRLLTFVWTLAPWLLIAVYFITNGLEPAQQAATVSPFVCPPPVHARAWPIIHVAMICVIAFGLIVAFAMDVVGRSRQTGMFVAVAVAVVVLIVAVMPALDFRNIGPLGSMALSYVFIFFSLAALASLSQWSGFPALTLTVAVIAMGMLFSVSVDVVAAWFLGVCLFFAAFALASRLWYVAAVALALSALVLCAILRSESHFASALPHEGAQAAYLEDRFEAWIQERGDRRLGAGGSERPYPAFIISAEGGGIYAATAASLFLAKLQDDCPGFAQHIFAISGVSGGAIGATIFQASIPRSPQLDVVKCSHDGDPLGEHSGDLTRKMTAIMEEDHFSPVVASIIGDLVGLKTGRSEALKESFEDVKDPKVAGRLQQPFLKHWSVDSAAPGLVLNATWAETGYRVAFAPFSLHRNGRSAERDSFYSFADATMPDENNIPLMRAAVVSASFPGILSPFTVKMANDHRWDFVDGGYSDWSGAGSALELFQKLKAKSCKSNVDLKMIILSSTDRQPKFQDVDGTFFPDIMGPAEAVMKVRALLGSQAVTRALDYFKQLAPCSGRNPDWQIQEIKLDDQEYALPLGWKLSNTTFKLVSFLVGGPGPCTPKGLQQQNVAASDPGASLEVAGPDISDEEAAPQNNHCVMDKIEELFDKG